MLADIDGYDRLMTLDEVGDVLALGRRAVERLVADGLLPAVKLRPTQQGPVRVRASDLARWIKERGRAGGFTSGSSSV